MFSIPASTDSFRLLQNRVQATHLFLKVMTWGGQVKDSFMLKRKHIFI